MYSIQRWFEEASLLFRSQLHRAFTYLVILMLVMIRKSTSSFNICPSLLQRIEYTIKLNRTIITHVLYAAHCLVFYYINLSVLFLHSNASMQPMGSNAQLAWKSLFTLTFGCFARFSPEKYRSRWPVLAYMPRSMCMQD